MAYSLLFDGANDRVSTQQIVDMSSPVKFIWRGKFDFLAGADRGIFSSWNVAVFRFVCWYDNPDGFRLVIQHNNTDYTNTSVPPFSTDTL